MNNNSMRPSGAKDEVDDRIQRWIRLGLSTLRTIISVLWEFARDGGIPLFAVAT